LGTSISVSMVRVSSGDIAGEADDLAGEGKRCRRVDAYADGIVSLSWI